MVAYLDVGALIKCSPPLDDCFVTSVALDVLELRLRFALESFLQRKNDVVKKAYALQSAYGSRARRPLSEILNIFARRRDSFQILFEAVALLIAVDTPRPYLVDALEARLPKSRRTTPTEVVKTLYNFIELANPQSLAASFRRYFEDYAEAVLGCTVVSASSYKEVRIAVETALRERHDADVEEVAQAYSIANHMLNTGLNSAKIHSPDAKFSQAIRLVREAFPKFAQLSLQHVHCSRS
ncbi:MAG: hypothetical protein QXI84_08330 [Thermofilaceae archaeon]